MSVAACPSEAIRLHDDETYARSLRTLRCVGKLAVTHALEAEDAGAVESLSNDFRTGVMENLRTAEGIEAYLDIESIRGYQMIDGQAMAPDGMPMVKIVERGYMKARADGEHDERMKSQARRDEGDLIIAEQANALHPGQLLLTASLPPLEGLARDPKFWGDLGYRSDLAYLQTYYKTETGETMLAGSFSVGRCDVSAWRRVLGHYGITVPDGAPADDFIRSFGVFSVSPLEAQHLGQRVRGHYYREIGENHRRQSVTEYVEMQENVVRGYFDGYMLPLAEAVYTGRNSPVLQQLAETILNTPAAALFSPAVVREVVRVANGAAFPHSAGMVMENLIRYALVERLREGLIAVVHGVDPGSVRIGLMSDVPYETMHQQLANDIASGVQAGREFGGCASLVLGSGALNEQASLQEAYGGRRGEGKENWTWKTGTCRVRNCQSPKPTEVGPCSVCRSCQRIFDSGRDPAKIVAASTTKKPHPVKLSNVFLRTESIPGRRGSSVPRDGGGHALQKLGDLMLAA